MKNAHNPARRKSLRTLASLAVAAPFITLVGCGSGSSSENSTDTSTDTDSGSGSDNSTDTSTSYGDWAQDGTASMTDDFPDTSIFDNGSTCSVSLTGEQTEGPCYFASDYLDDISFGETGLPMMLCLQLINANCEPLANYEVEVWHANVEGLYSGDTSSSSDAGRFSSSFCTGNDSEALNATWFRGIAVTDSEGRVNFKSCFPGWYSSRVIHIHFKIKHNNVESLTSQFAFADDFCDDICVNHPNYSHRGEPDTHLSNDTVFSRNADDYVFSTEQNSDGSLLAYKRIIVSE